jgi:hypothetical protein
MMSTQFALFQVGQVFQPFRRGASGRSNAKGIGLGLAISKSLVKKMGGKLAVSSTLGKGSTFSFQLKFDVASRTSPSADRPLVGHAHTPYAQTTRLMPGEGRTLLMPGGQLGTLLLPGGTLATNLTPSGTLSTSLPPGATPMQSRRRFMTVGFPSTPKPSKSATLPLTRRQLSHSSAASVLPSGQSLANEFRVESPPLRFLVVDDNALNKRLFARTVDNMFKKLNRSQLPVYIFASDGEPLLLPSIVHSLASCAVLYELFFCDIRSRGSRDLHQVVGGID